MFMAGILLGPSFLGHSQIFLDTLFPWKQASLLLTLSKIGVVYFVFITTMKMDIIATLRGARRCWLFGVIPFLSSYIVTALLLSFYNPGGKVDESEQIVPNVFTLSSFAVVTQALLELNLLTTELGQIALSSTLIAEIMQWTSMALQFKSMKQFNYSVEIVISLLAFVLFCVWVIRPIMKMIARKTPMGQPLKESYVVMILLGALVSAAISDYIGISFVIGPTIYGLVMPNGPPLATTISDKSEVIISQILMASFYIYVGINTNFTKIQNWKMVITFQCILFVGFMVKVIACVLLSSRYKIRPKHGMALGLILSVKGIIELLFFTRLRNNGIIDGQVFSQMVLYVVLMTSICAPLIKVLYKRNPRVLKPQNSVEGHVMRTIQNTFENIEFNIVSCLHNDGNVHSMIALLETCNPSKESPICVHVIHLIELSGKFTPVLLPMNKQNRKSLSINYPNTNAIFRAFENYSNNSSGPVTILSYINVAPYDSMHEAVCNLAEDKLVPFIIIPFHGNNQSLGTLTEPFIRDLNTNFLDSARCTVGILVDRYSSLGLSISKICFHVGIFFIGGTDDRESLALGIRMLERSNIRVTLLRFVMKNDIDNDVNFEMLNENDEVEKEKDESLVDEFNGKKYNNDNVVFDEVAVEDCIRLMEAIREMSTEKDYDLVMVGKRHSMGDLREEEMSNFMDNVDQLGIVGDMLASTEFCSGKVPILVLQCGENQVKQIERLGSTMLTKCVEKC
ncbi:putative cation/H+ exchanger, rossmann-like alpha/beta/alpha sandwich [Lupinus albus]|uniref:Putative cation/H+ exchanger, rossmann-like alpha/beta/alpha sandwich n=1 Tax=Lupinus albus TaxID=3870 RepID=A0A6A4Q3P1_LUPAL|nr:putative cation/H+ exchanger, rossmann-like alpha/beta/alpha sandwich [Lupinus albus]